MPRSTKPRKRYRPAPVMLDATFAAIDRAALLQPQQRESLQAPMRNALDAMRRGAGSWDAWRALADVCNVAEALARGGIGGNLLDKIDAAQDALAQLHARVTAGRGWTLRGPELTALDDACWVHEVQLQHASQGEVADAIQRVKRVVQGVLSGGAPGRHAVVGQLGAAA